MPAVSSVYSSSRRIVMVTGVLVASLRGVGAAAVDFNKDIRPILSEHCFHCHGPDEQARKGKLRLDTREGATAAAKSGEIAVVPGKPETSALLHRVGTHDEDDLMPPKEENKPLTPAKMALLRQWISEGAAYARHWAFEPPRAQTPPATQQQGWQRNGVDAFVLSRLERERMHPAPEAERGALLRRVTLDLTGLPPTLDELNRFLADTLPGAYERAVDRLLESPRYGERMAVEWLDAARYADTNGYFGDKTRSAWPWRDWVINAYNRNMPFDQFTIEQLAGDLLPDPTRDQLIATGFHRNSMANNESGIIEEEYRVETVVDRIDATATTWMGLTVGCAQCHDHKFDPITQKEFYQIFAFFNNTPERGIIKGETAPPVIEVASSAQETRMKQLTAKRLEAVKAFDPHETALKPLIQTWEKGAADELRGHPQGRVETSCGFEGSAVARVFREVGEGTLETEGGVLGMAAKFDGTKHLEGAAEVTVEADKPWTVALWLKGAGSLGCLFAKVEPEGNRRGLEMIWQKGKLQVNLVNRWGVNALEVVTKEQLRGATWSHVVLCHDGSGKAAGLRLMVDGRTMNLQVNRDTLSGSIRNQEPWRLGKRDSGLGFYGSLDEFCVLNRTVTEAEARSWYWSERLRGILARPKEKRGGLETTLLKEHFIECHASPEVRTGYQAIQTAKDEEDAFRGLLPTALVMNELPADKTRGTNVLMRGVYDQPGVAVRPGVPAALSPWQPGAPENRLGFARWLVARDNPLTARVAVNRLWQQCFGEGLVHTVNDFGSQGEAPTHPELLDWLAVRFMDSGWDVKALLRLMVTSATYRQSSRPSPVLLQRDPENRLLARGPRFRLAAEMLRDQALAVGGLLVNETGGPSVKPYQPPGLWEAVSYNGEESYVMDSDRGRWRRSIYTFWKRQAPPPATLAFDGPTREKCNVRRARTNTPLQALVLLNDETYLQAAEALTKMMLKNAGTDEARLREIFLRVSSRLPQDDETNALKGLLSRQRQRQPSELAVWTLVVHTLLNLDETITRR